MRLASSIAALLVASAWTAAIGPLWAQTPAGHRPAGPSRKVSAQPRPGSNADPRSLVPGVGGIVPAKPRTSAPSRPGGQAPAGISGPLPGLAGTKTGLRAAAANPLLFGVDVVWGRSGTRAGWDRDNMAWARRVATTLRASHAAVLRLAIDWAAIEKTRGVYDFADTDRFVRFCAGLDVQLVATFSHAPSWAMDNSPEVIRLFKRKASEALLPLRAPRAGALPDLTRVARACAARYRGRIRRWEFWPEPDASGMPVAARDSQGRPVDIQFGGDPRGYAEMLRAFAGGVRGGNPEALIAVGGLADRRPEVAVRFLSSLYANGARSYFDAVAVHPYSDNKPFATELVDAIHEAMARNGDDAKPVWITEWGWPTGPSFSELQQARWVREGLALMAARPYIGLACYHALNDWRFSETDPASLMTYGLVGANLAPKAAFGAFADAAAGQLPQLSEAPQIELIGAMQGARPGAASPEAVTVHLDADRAGAALPPLWQGLTQSYELNGAQLLENSVTRMADIGARLVRIDPFPDPGCVTPLPDGAPTGPFDPARIDWTYADRAIDAIVRAGARPMLCFATMPTALSSPGGNPRMPRDPAEWAGFLQAVVARYNHQRHLGIAYWELGSRPNENGLSLPEYLRLYDWFARAITGADPKAMVGGPDVCTEVVDWLGALAEHCARNNVALGFLSLQVYDAAPTAGAAQVRAVRDRLAGSAHGSTPEIVVSEWNQSDLPTPRLDGLAAATYALSFVEQLASVAPVKALYRQVRDGSDFRHVGARFTGRWGLLANDGTPKAVYNAFKLLNRMTGARLKADTDDASIHALASRGSGAVRTLIWSTTPGADSGVTSAPQEERPVKLQVRNLPWRGLSRGTLWVLTDRLGNAVVSPARGELRPAGRFQLPGPSADLILGVPAGGVVLVELEPSESAIRVSASTRSYTVYSGSRFTIDATIRNTGSARVTLTPTLTCTDPALTPDAAPKRSVSLAPGDTVATRYEIAIPAAHPLGQETFELSCGTGQACVQALIADPVSVRLTAPRVDVRLPDAAPDSLDGTASIGIVLSNHSAQRLPATLTYGGTQQSVTLAPGTSTTSTISLSPPSNKPGNYTVPVHVLLGDRADYTIPVAVGVPLLCHYARTTPRINGDLTEWADAFAIRLDQADQVRNKRWGGPADLSAQVLTFWDERYFYIAASVTDDVNVQPFSPEKMSSGDSLQFAIDARRRALPEAAGYSDDDHEFVLGMGPLRPAVYRLAGPRTMPLGLVTDARVAVRRVGNRTIYEAAIPWVELTPARPENGAVVGFSVLVNDNDGQGRGFIELTPGMDPVKEPGKFLALRLIKP